MSFADVDIGNTVQQALDSFCQAETETQRSACNGVASRPGALRAEG
jgi:hypothetical protein